MNRQNYKLLDDNTLCALTKKGDEKAFEEITLRYIKLIYSIAKDYNAYSYDIQDLAQEGLLSFLSACYSYSPDNGSSYKNYAVVCTKNRFNDILKKLNAKGAVPQKELVPMDILENQGDAAQSVEDYILQKEYIKTRLKHISSTLSQEEQKVFDMYMQGYSYKDISKKTHISTKKVDNMLQKIKHKFRES